jgi:hypothetical protein
MVEEPVADKSGVPDKQPASLERLAVVRGAAAAADRSKSSESFSQHDSAEINVDGATVAANAVTAADIQGNYVGLYVAVCFFF